LALHRRGLLVKRGRPNIARELQALASVPGPQTSSRRDRGGGERGATTGVDARGRLHHHL